jgi:hypothetical protein
LRAGSRHTGLCITICRALQLPVNKWHEVIAEPTFADAILDRIVHNAYRLDLDGPSMRKIKAAEIDADPSDATVDTTAKQAKAARK